MEDSRVAVVTGGGGTIGGAIAHRLAQDGLCLSLWDRDAEAAEAVAERVRDQGGEAIALHVDVAVWDSVRTASELTLKAFGRIDVLVNNAAIRGPLQPVSEVDVQDWTRVLAVDLIGYFYCLRAVLPIMIEQGGGRIVNVTGGGAGEPAPNDTAYGTAKTGVVRLTESVALEVARHNVLVNAVTPGLVDSPLSRESLAALQATDPGGAARFQQALETQAFPPEAAAELVAYLVSLAGHGLTGRWLTVYDDWRELARDPRRLMSEDLYVLRRHPR